MVPDLSRSRIQALIRAGDIRLEGLVTTPHHKVTGGMNVSIVIPPPVASGVLPEDLPLDVLYEDADIVVVNKRAGMVVHPSAGHKAGTLVNALLHHCPDMSSEYSELHWSLPRTGTR